MVDLTLDSMLAVERLGWWDSLCRSKGGTFYGQLMTPDAIMILLNGMVLNQETIADSLDEAPPWATYELADVRAVPIGDSSVALVYQATATRTGDATPFVALMASVYCLLEGEIRLALYQQTTITH